MPGLVQFKVSGFVLSNVLNQGTALTLYSQSFLGTPRTSVPTAQDLAGGVNASTTSAALGEPILEVTDKTEIEQKTTSGCLCDMGYFWHWRVHQCIQQGAWGYECGFFPGEHHHRVCADGLVCERLRGAQDNYESHGKYHDTSGSFPASCQHCEDEDQCKYGEARQKEECLKEYALSGEACQTVKVTVPSSATVSATVSHTAVGKAYADASAEATETVSHTASATATAEASHTSKQSHTATESASAKSTATATESVTATATSEQDGIKASATAEDSATVQQTESASVTKSATATEKASSTKTVEASAEATAEAQATATADVHHEERTEKTVTKSHTASAESSGVAVNSACVSLEEAKKELGLEGVDKVGAVLAQRIIDKANEMAFERASKFAIQDAQSQGLLGATDTATQVAEARAAEEAKLEAERLANEAAAWGAEAGANKAAQKAASARARGLAKDEAQVAAEEAAHRKAEAEAARKASNEAKAEADRLAAEAAKEGATDEAKAKAKAAAEKAANAEAQARASEEASVEAEAKADEKARAQSSGNADDASTAVSDTSSGKARKQRQADEVEPAEGVEEDGPNPLRKITQKQSDMALP